MNSKITAVVCLFLFGFGCSESESSLAVYNGHPAKLGQFPATVWVSNCMHTRVGHNLFLTAGHCVDQKNFSGRVTPVSRFLGDKIVQSVGGEFFVFSGYTSWRNDGQHTRFDAPPVSVPDLALIQFEKDPFPEMPQATVNVASLSIGHEVVVGGAGNQRISSDNLYYEDAKIRYYNTPIQVIDQGYYYTLDIPKGDRKAAGAGQGDSGGGVFEAGSNELKVIGVISNGGSLSRSDIQGTFIVRLDRPDIIEWLKRTGVEVVGEEKVTAASDSGLENRCSQCNDDGQSNYAVCGTWASRIEQWYDGIKVSCKTDGDQKFSCTKCGEQLSRSRYCGVLEAGRFLRGKWVACVENPKEE